MVVRQTENVKGLTHRKRSPSGQFCCGGTWRRQTGIENQGGHRGLPEVVSLYLGAEDEIWVTQAKVSVLQAEGMVCEKSLWWEPTWHFQEMERRGKINFIVIMKHVSVSYCYITNYPRTMWLQNTNIYYLTQFLNVRNLGVR